MDLRAFLGQTNAGNLKGFSLFTANTNRKDMADMTPTKACVTHAVCRLNANLRHIVSISNEHTVYHTTIQFGI